MPNVGGFNQSAGQRCVQQCRSVQYYNRNSGENYAIGDAIVITGDLIGGATPTNDLTINVTDIDTGGEVLVTL